MEPESGLGAAGCEDKAFGVCCAGAVHASRATAKEFKTARPRIPIPSYVTADGRETLRATSLQFCYAAMPSGTGWAQWAQRLASMGISLRHSGHFLVVGSAGAGALRIRATNRFTGVTTKKYTAAATNTNDTPALTKSPRANMLPLTVNLIAEKSGLPTTAAISGVSRSLVKAETTEANAAPITTPTAMSITLPRRMNCLNPLSMWPSLKSDHFTADKGCRQVYARLGRVSDASDSHR